MKNAQKIIAMVLVTIMALSLIGCSRNGGNNAATHIGPRKTAADTQSATMSGNNYPDGVQLNWYDSTKAASADAADITLSGIQHIIFILDGDEKMEAWTQDRELSSISLQFTGLTSGKTATLENSLIGNVSKVFTADTRYFHLNENSFSFYPHYFNVGEVVSVNAVFTYTRNLLDSKTAEGYFQFTVGEDTGETFSGPLEDISSTLGNLGDSLKDTFSGSDDGNNTDPTGDDGTNPTEDKNSSTGLFGSGMFFTDVRYRVNGKTEDYLIERYEEDSLAKVITLSDTTLKLTVYTRESDHDIVKAYIDLPDGSEAVWSNDWYEDNCHKFVIDLSSYSGKTVTLNIRLLAGAEWCPTDFMYGFITVKVP